MQLLNCSLKNSTLTKKKVNMKNSNHSLKFKKNIILDLS